MYNMYNFVILWQNKKLDKKLRVMNGLTRTILQNEVIKLTMTLVT
jgi:hypothetical protein